MVVVICPDCGGEMARIDYARHPEDPDGLLPPVYIEGRHLPEYGCADPIEDAYRLGYRAARRREVAS